MSENTQKKIDEACKYRGLPRVLKHSACEVDGKRGIVVGGNSSCNLNVRYDDMAAGYRNCHPGWKMKIFNDDGSLLYASADCDKTEALK
jgi:hypothetical protein